jgi:hypothetical protein
MTYRHRRGKCALLKPASQGEAYSSNYLEDEFCEVRGYKVSFVAARISLKVFAGGTFTARSAQYRHSRYSEVWQAVATCYLLTTREFLHIGGPNAPESP